MLRDSTRGLEPSSAVISCRVARSLQLNSIWQWNYAGSKYTYGASQTAWLLEYYCLVLVMNVQYLRFNQWNDIIPFSSFLRCPIRMQGRPVKQRITYPATWQPTALYRIKPLKNHHSCLVYWSGLASHHGMSNKLKTIMHVEIPTTLNRL